MTEAETSTLEPLWVTEESTPKPETNTAFPRIYGHVLCPFVEKTRLAFAAKGVPYQSVECDLGKKTPWHLAINGGLVPVLELPDGTIITESKIIMDYVEDAYPTTGFSLLPKDPVTRAKMRLGINLLDGYSQAFYPIYMKKAYDEADFVKLRDAI
jgi:glutathione S-transferase